MNQFVNLHNLFLSLYKQLLDNYTYKYITLYIYIYIYIYVELNQACMLLTLDFEQSTLQLLCFRRFLGQTSVNACV